MKSSIESGSGFEKRFQPRSRVEPPEDKDIKIDNEVRESQSTDLFISISDLEEALKSKWIQDSDISTSWLERLIHALKKDTFPEDIDKVESNGILEITMSEEKPNEY